MNAEIPLVDLIDLKLQEGEVELPVFDTVAHDVYRATQNSSMDAEGLCKILQDDPVLVSEILRMSNSSFFSGLAQINTIHEAVVRLGLKQVSTLVLSVSQKRMYSASKGRFHDRMVALWRHVSVASLSARWIASNTGYRKIADQVHIAALLHDVGKLSLLRIIEELANSDQIASLNEELVDNTLDRLYCAHGAKLLELWELPEIFVDVVMHQADEQLDESNPTLAIVRLADKACAKEGVSDRPDPDLCLDTLPETQFLGLDEIALAELCIAIEDARGLEAG